MTQYQRNKEILTAATPTKLPDVQKTLPNYITQDDDKANLVNLLFNECLPKIEQTIQINPTDIDLHTANHMHERLFRNSLPKTNVCNPTTPLGIKAEALYHLMGTHLENKFLPVFTPHKLEHTPATLQSKCILDQVCNGVVHPVTKETITKYKKLANDPLMKGVWTKAMCKEFGRLAQGYGDKEGTNTIFFMTIDEIKQIPKDRTVTYARIVVDYRPQKDDPNRVRITVGGNLIDYPGELTTSNS